MMPALRSPPYTGDHPAWILQSLGAHAAERVGRSPTTGRFSLPLHLPRARTSGLEFHSRLVNAVVCRRAAGRAVVRRRWLMIQHYYQSGRQNARTTKAVTEVLGPGRKPTPALRHLVPIHTVSLACCKSETSPITFVFVPAVHVRR
jgi:hypothetical protein